MNVKAALTQEVMDKFVQVSHMDFDSVKAMLEAEPELLHATGSLDGETPIQAASHMGRRKIAEYLLEKGAPLDICTASMLGHADKVVEMLAANEGLAHARGAHGIPLAYFVALGGNLKIAEAVFNHGADLNLGAGTNTALHAAVLANRTEMAEWLLQHGSDPNLTNFESKTPLQVAIAQQRTQLEEVIRRFTSSN
jgi:ankyrin repeat protein